MVAHLLGVVLTLSGLPAYLLVGGLALGESAAFVGLVLPGETALLYGGVLAGRGNVSLPVLLLVATVAAVVGDSIGYELGRRVGPPLRGSRAGRWVGESRWAQAEDFLQRSGGAAVLLGRWVGLLRALVPTLAGMGRMPYRRFLAWNLLGGVTWASTLVGLGYLFSRSVTALVGTVASVGTVLTLLAVAGVSLAVARRRVRAGLSTIGTAAGGVVARLGPRRLAAVLGATALVTSLAVLGEGLLDDGAAVASDQANLTTW